MDGNVSYNGGNCNMWRRKIKGSYTLEAAIYIPMILFMLFGALDIGVHYWQKSRERIVSQEVLNLDIVQEFYGYQVLEEIGKELGDGES